MIVESPRVEYVRGNQNIIWLVTKISKNGRHCLFYFHILTSLISIVHIIIALLPLGVFPPLIMELIEQVVTRQ